MIVSVKPVVLPGGVRVRVTAPVAGQGLPVLVFSHGFGSSFEAYGPLVDFWAAHGFVVVQPTFLDSRTVGLAPDDPRVPGIWRQRVEDVRTVLDHLDLVEAAVPGLAGRVDRDLVAAAGHSFGGNTTANLLGLRVLGASGQGEDLSDPRVRAGVLLATAGRGGDDLSEFAAEHFPFMNVDFSHMTTPALVVAGDRDDSPMTVRGPDWMADPFRLSPGRKELLTFVGAEHSLGGIPGYEAAETTDEHPGRVALLQRLTWAWLWSELHPGDPAWTSAVAELDGNPLAHLESRS